MSSTNQISSLLLNQDLSNTIRFYSLESEPNHGGNTVSKRALPDSIVVTLDFAATKVLRERVYSREILCWKGQEGARRSLGKKFILVSITQGLEVLEGAGRSLRATSNLPGTEGSVA